MRLTVIGGGGFRTPMVCRAFSHGEAGIEEIRLYDPDRERLDVIQAVLAGQPGLPRTRPAISTFTDLDAALVDTDFIFMAIRVGGLNSRSQDERDALELGLIGQETTGPAGIAYGMRTVPAAMAIAQRIAEVCPQAFLINFTNPVGMITEVMASVLGTHVIGVCDTPRGLGIRVANALGIDMDELRFDYVGLNHLGWLRAVTKDGVDLLPRLLADDDAAAQITEVRVLGTDLVRMLGMIPNEYLYFYYHTREAVELLRKGPTRGEFLVGQQGDFYSHASESPTEAYQTWRRATSHRNALYMSELRQPDRASGHPARQAANGSTKPPGSDKSPASKPRYGGYEGVARNAIMAIAADRRAEMILNVPNQGAIPQLDDDAVVEVSCSVGSGGATALPVAPLTLHQIGLMNQVKGVERLAIEAVKTRSYSSALAALSLHPLVDSVTVARTLLDRFIASSPELESAIGNRPIRRTPTASHS